MSDHSIQLLTLVVQTLALIGLSAYCIETYKIRVASQKQIDVSQNLLKISMDQVEGFSKPCITFWSELRNGQDVILEMHGATGNLVARPDGGSYVIHNLGNGLALNLRYYVTRNNPQLDQDPERWRYIPTVPVNARVALVETLGHFNQEH